VSATGKRRLAGVPHKGWTCTNIEDCGEPQFVCEMCEVQEIRFVHEMWHDDYGALKVGCVCAGHMEENIAGARQREARFKQRQSRRARWLRRTWRVSAKGNPFLNTDGFNVVVFTHGTGWAARILDTWSDRSWFLRGYASEVEAKLATFDVVARHPSGGGRRGPPRGPRERSEHLPYVRVLNPLIMLSFLEGAQGAHHAHGGAS
jgi:hypothetical protein